jgi:hypothetical protein
VTGHTVSHGHRSVNLFLDGLVVDMALITEPARRARFEPVAVRGLVRIVAGSAETEADRSVNHLLDIQPSLVAQVAKLALLPRHLKPVFSGVVHRLLINWHMTTDTFACSHRTVHIPLLFEVVVTVKTRSFLRRGCVAYPTRQQRP